MAHTQGEPIILRRAKAFAHMLESMALEIPDGALIVGRHPKTTLNEEEAARIREEWRRVADPPEDGELHYQNEGLFRAPIIILHLAPDAEKALHTGFDGLCEEIRKRLSVVKEEAVKDFLRAALICAEAAGRFIQRHADLALEMAASEEDQTRRAELQEIAAVCRRIALEPPNTFREALQLIWFIYLLVNLESDHIIHCAGPGTLDRWLIEFYRKDVKAQRLTPEQALEVLECFFVEMNASLPRGGILPLAIGGLKAEGEGAENELTWLCLKSVADLRMLHPSLALRYHRNMPR
ncbi:MAG: hypothetical protein GTO55_04185, partial [Armatimonadetes bacterium]|nr:hypothetical protein [Armatimonadota bacterium]NIM23470.1 hypothetical protein [Armatimonadota bacterium]NIM67336.1 hypothetical protein [Armatimonadota bacterium]NIM75837.1 hypothetical protein [Armatimonadota bacterium]NIN05522.1 hypothetical protein [Armatimonadota bacterium]